MKKWQLILWGESYPGFSLPPPKHLETRGKKSGILLDLKNKIV